jgi:hypothetical protein
MTAALLEYEVRWSEEGPRRPSAWASSQAAAALLALDHDDSEADVWWHLPDGRAVWHGSAWDILCDRRLV